MNRGSWGEGAEVPATSAFPDLLEDCAVADKGDEEVDPILLPLHLPSLLPFVFEKGLGRGYAELPPTNAWDSGEKIPQRDGNSMEVGEDF